MRLRLSPTVLVVLAATVIGCGDSAERPTSTTAEPTPTVTGEQTAPRGPRAETTDDVDTKPVITVPEQPAQQLIATDIVEGEGPEAKAGDSVSVDYVGVSQSTGGEFDASWTAGEPFSFQLGAGMVIPGWDQGVEGMKVGGRRLLTIPSELAYGPAGSPPDIPPDDTLIFAIDMRDIQQP